MNLETKAYNLSQSEKERAICELLAIEIDRNLPDAENKIWHRHPVWFLEGNPTVDYLKLNAGIRLMFWSGMDFGEEKLKPGTEKFKDASILFTSADQIDPGELERWLEKAKKIQWDYKNLIKRKVKLKKTNLKITAMKKPVQPYLHFDENCKEAMRFYQSLFGGDLELMAIGDSPAKDQFPTSLHHQILHSSLKNGDFNLMASDMCGKGKLDRGNSVQLSLDCSSEEEIHSLYQKLSDGGKVMDELKEQFWGALFAMVIDKFGVRWMLSYEKNQSSLHN